VINIELQVDPSLDAFTLEIFDGDMGSLWDRWWESPFDQLTFKLYRDPEVDGYSTAADLLYTWPAGQMPDDDWCTLNPAGTPVCSTGTKIPRDADAHNAVRGFDYYHLVADWNTPLVAQNEQNNFKVRLEGTPFVLAGSTIGFEGFQCVPETWWYPGGWVPVPLYDGHFAFYFYVAEDAEAIDLYDGDADFEDDTDDLNSLSTADCRGPYVGDVDYDGMASADCGMLDCDGDGEPDQLDCYEDRWDANGPCFAPWDSSNGPWYVGDDDQDGLVDCGFPPFQTSPLTFVEGDNPGDPPDNFHAYPPFITGEAVHYSVTFPAVEEDPSPVRWTVENNDISGDQEWELFRIGTPGVADPEPDVEVEAIAHGLYRWDFWDLDCHNTMFLHTDHDVFPKPASLGNTVWYDANRDGIWAQTAEEYGIAGVVVELWGDLDRDGTLEHLRSTTTNSEGYYDFLGLMPAQYKVVVSSSNFGTGGVLEAMTQTPNKFAERYPDHHNRQNRWPVTIPMPMDYIKADFGYIDGSDFCIWDPDDPEQGATGQFWIHTIDGVEVITIRTTLNLNFSDTAYGDGSKSTGWPGQGRRFKQVYTSDNLEMRLYDGDGNVAMEFGLDLIEKVDGDPVGYATLGVDGGDGYLSIGNRADIVSYETSQSWNLHHSGWTDTTTSPPVTVDEYGTYHCPDYPDWIWEAWYEITIDMSAFGEAGFGWPEVWQLHASPSKTGEEQPDVEPCPPNWRDLLIQSTAEATATAPKGPGKK
jgi:hypothetical protein